MGKLEEVLYVLVYLILPTKGHSLKQLSRYTVSAVSCLGTLEEFRDYEIVKGLQVACA